MSSLHVAVICVATVLGLKLAGWAAWFAIRLGHQQLHFEEPGDCCGEEGPRESAIGFRVEQDPDEDEEDED